MRLAQLEMQNFGPYRHESIDFSDFETTPVFLISGKTGSGKTTIFDALVFALYGTTTGGERTGAEMRANFATSKEPTRVVLDFSHENRHYRITRAPDQLLAKKRGRGLTKVSAKVSLQVFKDGVEAAEFTKIQQVREQIENLLHLDADQFRQMVLLPQGKFRQFLDANSDTKGALLRHLFGTSQYARWQKALLELAKQQAASRQKQAARLETLAAQFDYGAFLPAANATLADRLQAMAQALAAQQSALADQQTKAQTAKAAYEQANHALQTGTAIAHAYAQKAQAQKALAKLAAQADQLTAAAKRLQDLQWAHDWQPVFAQVQTQRQQRDALGQQRRQTQTALNTAAAAVDDLQAQQDALQVQAVAIANAREQLAGMSRLQTQLETLQQAAAEVQAATTAQQAAKAAQQAAQEAAKAGQARLAANAAAQQALAKADQTPAAHQAEQLLTQLQGLAQQRQQVQQRLAANQVQLQQAQAALTQAQKTLAERSAFYTALNDQRLTAQIAELVLALSPGAPCPVCGSTTHPHPAASTAKAVAPADYQAAIKARDTAQAAAAQAQAQVQQLQAQKSQWQVDCQALAAQIQAQAKTHAQADAEATLTAVKQRVAALNQAVAQAQTKQQDLQAAAQQLTQAQQALDQALQTAAAKAQAAALTTASATAKYTAAQEAVPEQAPALADLQAETAALTKRVQQYDDTTAQTTQALQAARLTHTRLQTTLDDLTTQQQQLTQTLQQAEARLHQALRKHHQTDQATFAAWVKAAKEIPALTQQLQAAREAKAQQMALLAAAEAAIGPAPLPDLPALTAQRQAADETASAASAQLATATHALAQAKTLHDTIDRDYQANQQALAEAAALQDLAAVVNGNNDQKLSLERYVLRAYLQQVLVVANQRLQGLSDGRYQLQLHGDPGSYRNDSGLEIDVYDDQVGETRSVHTLSGGESFIAALGLALALGEVIQQEAGGITIDALFIDEGFGSLDSASLAVALDALESIEGQSRMIGIISHVESLQTGIPDQLRVTPTGAGDSHITPVHLGA
ncbi:AAA family ATPase [Lacticaseibacillus baoqingensis]|uniref:Nuclease SbcCD subunit C n=1 Tax=Lacticaseibacillus baoqingensis TaxID=2486013 RepID=A0ABW4E9H1_9LACO|nr:SMC family ATPase [Lacticaseibacillus baoqingensis]